MQLCEKVIPYGDGEKTFADIVFSHIPNYKTPLKMYLPDEIEIRQPFGVFNGQLKKIKSTFCTFKKGTNEYAGLTVSFWLNGIEFWVSYGDMDRKVPWDCCQGPYIGINPEGLTYDENEPTEKTY